MKKTLLLNFIVVLFLLSMFGEFVAFASADPFFPSGARSGEVIPPLIGIQSPSAKLTYWVESDVWLDFTVRVPMTPWYGTESFANNSHFATTFGGITNVTFSFDGNVAVSVNKSSEYQGVAWFSVNLGKLAAGSHTVTISVEGTASYGILKHDHFLGSNYSFSEDTKTKSVQNSVSDTFSVATSRPVTAPKIAIITPTSKTYYYISDWTSITYEYLHYSADDTRLSVGYRLDTDTTVTPATNGTRLYIPIQSRSLTLYANDSFGNAATPQTVYYSIERYVESAQRMPHDPRYGNFSSNDNGSLYHSPISPRNLFSTLVVIATPVLLIIVVASICLTYLKKRKQKMPK